MLNGFSGFSGLKRYFTYPSSKPELKNNSDSKLKNNSDSKLKNNSNRELKNNLQKYKNMIKNKKIEPNNVINSMGNLGRFDKYKDRDGNSILHIAIQQNWIPVVRMLLLRKDLNKSNELKHVNYFNSLNYDKYTPLALAISKGNADIVKILSESPNIDINLESYDKNTPLMISMKGRNKDIISILLGNPKNLQGRKYTLLSPEIIAARQKARIIENGGKVSDELFKQLVNNVEENQKKELNQLYQLRKLIEDGTVKQFILPIMSATLGIAPTKSKIVSLEEAGLT